MSLTPQQFIQKWQGSTLNERQSYQAHFADLRASRCGNTHASNCADVLL
jgi:hypothetical protein